MATREQLLRLINNPAVITTNDLSPSPPPGRQGDGINYIYSILRLLTDTMFTLPAVSPKNRLYITKNKDDKFGGNIQTAIDSITDESPTNPYVIEILSPGVYSGNFILKENVYLANTGNQRSTILTSATGDTLTIPANFSGTLGITIESTSSSNSDAAVAVTTGSPPPPSNNLGTTLIQTSVTGPNGAACIRTLAGIGGIQVGFIQSILNGNTTGTMIELLGASVVLFDSVAVNINTGTVLRATAASINVLLNTVLQNASGGAGWIIDCDGALVLVFSATFIEASNLIRGQNGALLGIIDMPGFSNPSGTRLDLDATSVILIGNFVPSPGSGDPYTGWVVADPSTVAYLSSLDFMVGTTMGPDTRPVAPKPGMGFYATNLAPAVVLTFIPGVGWVDPAGTIIP